MVGVVVWVVSYEKTPSLSSPPPSVSENHTQHVKIPPPALRERKDFSLRHGGKSYRYTLRQYMPSYRLLRSEKGLATFDSPEALMQSLGSVMYRGDYDAFLELWDFQSRHQLKRHNKGAKVDTATIGLQWQEKIGSANLVLTQRVDTASFVFVYLDTEEGLSSRDGQSYPFAMRCDGEGRWWLTNAAAEHPVFESLAGILEGTSKPKEVTAVATPRGRP